MSSEKLDADGVGGGDYSKRSPAKYFESTGNAALDKCFQWLIDNGYWDYFGALAKCGRHYVEVEDENGHKFLKRIFCGREFCPVCGEEGSDAHDRRYERIFGRLMWSEVLGYVVLTIPDYLRDRFRDVEMLKALHKAGWRVVQQVLNPDGALTVLHLFGDQGDNFNPHLNVVFPIEEGWQSKGSLNDLRRQWRLALEKLLSVTIPEDKENANYHYRDSEAKKMHTLKYVSRPVCGFDRFMRLDDELRKFLLGLNGFHNFRWYGRLSNSTYKKYFEEEGINIEEVMKKFGLLQEDKGCPICGEKLKFVGSRREFELTFGVNGWRKVGPGWYADRYTYEVMKEQGLISGVADRGG